MCLSYPRDCETQVRAVVDELHWGSGTIIYLIQPRSGMKHLFHSMLSSIPSPWRNVEHHHLSENDLLTILKNRKANDPQSAIFGCNNTDIPENEGENLTPTCFSDLLPNDLVGVLVCEVIKSLNPSVHILLIVVVPQSTQTPLMISFFEHE